LILRRQAAQFPAASFYTTTSLGAVIASLNANATLSLPPSMLHRRLPQHRHRAVTASFGAASLDTTPSLPRPHRRLDLTVHLDHALPFHLGSTSPSHGSLPYWKLEAR
jgi:hypothetical protein